MAEINFNYYHGKESEQFSFFRIPKVLYTDPIFSMFDKAIQKYPDAKPIFHSDRGFQYTGNVFKGKLEEAGMTQSMSRVGKCIDNGPMEGFFGTLKTEMFYGKKFKTLEELRAKIVEYIKFYNKKDFKKG